MERERRKKKVPPRKLRERGRVILDMKVGVNSFINWVDKKERSTLLNHKCIHRFLQEEKWSRPTGKRKSSSLAPFSF